MSDFASIPRIWEGECFVIGGGKSLSTFSFDKLKDKQVIGCNDAYLLGAEICNFCCFGDAGWHNIHGKRLESEYKSLVYGNAEKIKPVSNVKICRRTDGLVKPEVQCLGWFQNTGAMGIELAAKLGATTIYLLGFDMKLTENEANWYKNLKDKPNAKVYPKFIKWFTRFAQEMKKTFPDVKIINLNPDSGLEIFPKERWESVIQ